MSNYQSLKITDLNSKIESLQKSINQNVYRGFVLKDKKRQLGKMKKLRDEYYGYQKTR